MSQSLTRGLTLLEAVDLHGPLSLADLTRQLGWDKASVSRTVASLTAQGWLVRESSMLRLGARATLLGHGDATDQAARAAEPLVHAVSAITGLPTQAYALAGDRAMIMAAAAPPGVELPPLRSIRLPLWATAGGKVIAAQLSDRELDLRVPEETLPAGAVEVASAADVEAFQTSYGSWTAEVGGDTTTVRTRTELRSQLAAIRSSGVFVERREVGPNGACVAVPWPRAGLIATLACIGTVPDVERDRDRIEGALRAAAAPGATRDSVLRAATT